MGEVWRAEDSKLGREVAIKVLPADFVENADRLARFEREAKVLASLNHQNIAGIFEVGEAAQDGSSIHFLVMELVEGQDLSERLDQRPMSVEEAIPIALQIAEALEEAHEKGVVHRDLKPQNIKLTPGGPTGTQVKVLDFGLAKAMDPDDPISGSSPQLTHSPTMTLGATVEGVIMGTAAYMAPEQAKGASADKRADIWAFGVVLKELLTGKRLFDAPTAPEILAKVLTAGPEAAELPASTPPALRRLVDRCLQREPRERLRDIGDARIELEAAKAELESGVTSEATDVVAATDRPPRWREAIPWVLLLVALIFVFGERFGGEQEALAPEEATIRLPLALDENLMMAYIDQPILDFSPDGRSLAFVAFDGTKQLIYIRDLDSGEARPLVGTEAGYAPVFSPDGREVAFVAESELRRIPVEGGRSVKLTDVINSRGADWSSDGSFIFSPDFSAGLFRLSGETGAVEPVAQPDAGRDERTYRWPNVSPDGKTVLFTIGFNSTPNDYENAEIAAMNLETGEMKILVEGASMARFLSDNRLIYGSGGRFHLVDFDRDSLQLVGTARPVLDSVGGDPSSGIFYLATAGARDLAYVAGSFSTTRSHLTVVDLDEGELQLETPGPLVSVPRFSPDGEQIAFTQGNLANNIGDIWTYTLADKALNRVSFGDSQDTGPVYSSSGEWIAFMRSEGGVVRTRADGTGSTEPLVPSDSADIYHIPESFSADDRILALTRVGGGAPAVLIRRPSGEVELFEEDASSPSISPNGKWVAFSSPGSGDSTVVVRPLEGEGRWQVSPEEGGYPQWANQGRELLYLNIEEPSRPIMKVDILPGESFRFTPPELVLDEVGYRFATVTAPETMWDVSDDGRKFAFVELDRDDNAQHRIELVLNWAAELAAGSN